MNMKKHQSSAMTAGEISLRKAAATVFLGI